MPKLAKQTLKTAGTSPAETIPPQPSYRRPWWSALAAAVLTLVLGGSVLGVQLESTGITTTVRLMGMDTWGWLLAAALAVFLHQLVRPQIEEWRARTRKPSRFSVPDVMSGQKRQLWIMLAIGALLIFPFLSNRSAVDLATLTLIYIMLGLGLNVVVGLAGLLDLGYVGFYAVGAYTYALLNSYLGFSFWEALPIAGLMTALFGYLLGFPVLRLRGDYLAIVTLGFGEIIRILLNNWTELTGGPNGIARIPKPTLFNLEFSRRADEGNIAFHEFFGIDYDPALKVIYLYLLALILVLITLFVIYRLLRMPIGRAWEALREDDIACRSLGMNPTGIKLSAFTIGASFAGFAGAFFAARQGFISPESFTFIESAIILAIVVLGGMGSQLGVILAAIAMTLLPELAREFNEYRMLLFGLMMVLMMVWRPQGLVPLKRPQMELDRG
ncbi:MULTISPECIES: high-affinity branched-chain amino acid ABC transporter permease LivM [unclassified Cobetia]|uniref:high-affinity branched-chain amino acid ABC transporter permease LivM n=1 Tax=unclassified Cobetia TaxID=2609414 RepID=UPI00159DF2C7|nr:MULTISPECIES: high-affinity branched-chain amino acid ABC transporter permease LivM [unclassified Cobetia]MCO7233906.1 high-affinity branched-chain amino acid ABC transporter permease LivM [Cobetia sp. Dlab-2-AX]MCO7237204.1 high-affinity branched-chain amino acid ABC transporter permease LivM [Cobetia sp. Dlab-2-U]MDL2191430.1 high-affinity branched-chain amino acid ABC transporter permease LivM [Cobetia sp. LC6]NVN56115.1 high-affinity branched-chain amino acid ABC transporter permease Liv